MRKFLKKVSRVSALLKIFQIIMPFTLNDATQAIQFILSVVKPEAAEDKRDLYSALAQLLP